MKRRLLALAGCLALVTSTPAFAQLAPPNDLGVALGHIHLVVKNVDAQKEFWTTMLGGTMVSNGPLTLIQFPGVFIMLRQGEATGPPAGSIVNHFGFVYKDLAAARARWKAAGVKFDVGETNPNQGYVYVPDSSIRVEVFGDPSLPGPVSMAHSSLSAAGGHPSDSGVVCEGLWRHTRQASARRPAGLDRLRLLSSFQSVVLSR